eukprot:TRINITY_DN1259_c0_g1_i1.p1 TRINITY_DN1259_c0_g1~~TRINITY_DN1259_c0_g1_i1.p1  ORF type:complete len:728 (-),score=170.55 TRINITY_DN1259_c0_g1_i1:46-2172(-)
MYEISIDRQKVGENNDLAVHIFDDPNRLAENVSEQIISLILEKRCAGEQCVLGLPTGSTPKIIYKKLIEAHENGLCFDNCIIFNITEFKGIEPLAKESSSHSLRSIFLDQINFPLKQYYYLDGSWSYEDIEANCANFEYLIRKFGGFDFILLGLGRTHGHIGFNEAGSKLESRTRLVVLDEVTRLDIKSNWSSKTEVPKEALTLGVGTILEARRIFLICTGEHKASIFREVIEKEPRSDVPASYLQLHPNAVVYCDDPCASQLTRVKCPWTAKGFDGWNDYVAKKATIHLAKLLNKPITHLYRSDFEKYSFHRLVHQYKSCDTLSHLVFSDLLNRVCQSKDLPRNQRIIVFSPHPDDDVISMAGMLQILRENNNDVTVAYCVSGSVAVSDSDLSRHIEFVERLMEEINEVDCLKSILSKINEDGQTKGTSMNQVIKGIIRQTEAIAALKVLGFDENNARFLNLPFYHSGTIGKLPITQNDVDIVLNLLREIKPFHIFVAADLDPHGTHQSCFDIIKSAYNQYTDEMGTKNTVIQLDTPSHLAKSNLNLASSIQSPLQKQEILQTPVIKKESIMSSKIGRIYDTPMRKKVRQNFCFEKGAEIHRLIEEACEDQPIVWQYRGAWNEYSTSDASCFVPLTRFQSNQKINAIQRHESQKHGSLFPGLDSREFYERANDRNIQTANELDQLGLPQFYAAESFIVSKGFISTIR